MKMKIIVIFVCMLLIITALSATGAVNVHTTGYVRENKDLEHYQNNPTKSPGIIYIKIDGQVTSVYDSNNLLEGKIQVNDSINGKYNYDTGAPDSEPDPNLGIYEYNSSTFGIELEAGGFIFKTDPITLILVLQFITIILFIILLGIFMVYKVVIIHNSQMEL